MRHQIHLKWIFYLLFEDILSSWEEKKYYLERYASFRLMEIWSSWEEKILKNMETFCTVLSYICSIISDLKMWVIPYHFFLRTISSFLEWLRLMLFPVIRKSHIYRNIRNYRLLYAPPNSFELKILLFISRCFCFFLRLKNYRIR